MAELDLGLHIMELLGRQFPHASLDHKPEVKAIIFALPGGDVFHMDYRSGELALDKGASVDRIEQMVLLAIEQQMIPEAARRDSRPWKEARHDLVLQVAPSERVDAEIKAVEDSGAEFAALPLWEPSDIPELAFRVLMEDTPLAIHITEGHARAWGVPSTEVARIARSNTLKRFLSEDTPTSTMPVPGGSYRARTFRQPPGLGSSAFAIPQLYPKFDAAKERLFALVPERAVCQFLVTPKHRQIDPAVMMSARAVRSITRADRDRRELIPDLILELVGQRWRSHPID